MLGLSETSRLLLIIILEMRIALIAASAADKYFNPCTLSPVPSFSDVCNEDHQGINQQEAFGHFLYVLLLLRSGHGHVLTALQRTLGGIYVASDVLLMALFGTTRNYSANSDP